MAEHFYLLNLPASKASPIFEDKSIFHLRTCQRSLFIGREIKYDSSKLLQGEEAYRNLLEIICGLKSKLIAESEIVCQFKKAYQDYLSIEEHDNSIVRVLEKLFQDAKKIRAEYLTKIGQHSYAGLSKKILSQQASQKEVLILGSGAMALNLIKVLHKRFNVYVSARNNEAVEKICNVYPVKPIQWGDHARYFKFSNIINTIGTNKTLFKHHFFLHWSPEKRVFIDIGTPCSLDTTLGIDDGIFKLDDIFQKGIELDKKKQVQIEKSKIAIELLASKRHQYFLRGNSLESNL